eukprot:gene6655-biopygen13783
MTDGVCEMHTDWAWLGDWGWGNTFWWTVGFGLLILEVDGRDLTLTWWVCGSYLMLSRGRTAEGITGLTLVTERISPAKRTALAAGWG